jgi:diguanylate cyclase (GGDEF)-like protein
MLFLRSMVILCFRVYASGTRGIRQIVAPKKHSWGIIIFIGAVVGIVVLTLLFYKYPPQRFPALYHTTLPVATIIFSLLSLLTGHISYPRVHNLKVYLAGYLTGCTGLGFGMIGLFPQYGVSMQIVLMTAVYLNLFLVLLLPAYCKYRITRLITYIIVVCEVTILSLMYALPHLSGWALVAAAEDFYSVRLWATVFWLLAVGTWSVWSLRQEFHLGGIVCGMALFYSAAMIFPHSFLQGGGLQTLLLAAAPLYLDAGILLHWLARMEHRVSYDPLLHIYNRNYCSRIIAEQSSLKTVPPLGIAMIDIDHFKNVNDTYGHDAGDHVLQVVAQTIQNEVVPDGIACRYGGEEIIVFFPKKESREVIPIVESVRMAVSEQKIPARKKKISVTVSCGVSHREDGSQSIMDVINAADKALYRAKNNGRNQVKFTRTAIPKQKKR